MKGRLMAKRHCTLLKIGNIRYWFEKRYGPLCEQHDIAYKEGRKWQGDKELFKGMIAKGEWKDYPIATVTFILVQLPWVWYSYYSNKD